MNTLIRFSATYQGFRNKKNIFHKKALDHIAVVKNWILEYSLLPGRHSNILFIITIRDSVPNSDF